MQYVRFLRRASKSLQLFSSVNLLCIHSDVGITFVRIVYVKVETAEEDDCNEKGDESQKHELLEKARLLELNSKLVLLFGQFVSFAFEQGHADIFHYLSLVD